MALAKRSAAYQNGLDKKYDGNGYPHGESWQPNTKMRSWITIRKRRTFLALLVMGLVYLFFKNMPTDVPPAGMRIDSRTGLSQGRMPMAPGPKPKTKSGEAVDGLYEGPVRFYELASTMREHLHHVSDGRENMVIPLHDLRSAASLTSLACDIALHNKTIVHMLLLCPQDSSIEEVAQISGIRQQNCPIFWHDARPDYHSQSSLARRKITVQAALGHAHAYLSPRMVLLDQQQAKNAHFMAAVKSALDQTWTPLSIIPNDALTTMNWITSLDANGFSLLNQNQIDIVITPYQYSSGSLIRLLRSIQSAHYEGLPLPRITVEMPPSIDTFALRFLESFRWPSDTPASPSRLILRRRLDTGKISTSLGSLRTLESFYPPTYPMSHVLLLDPDVELAPGYLHYLYYLTLTYKYGSSGNNITSALVGISLDAPQSSASESTSEPNSWAKLTDAPFVLLQSPTSAATLYFGDKWAEMQTYVSLRLQHDPDLSKKVHGDPDHSRSKPAWHIPALEFMRARNYYTLYPTFSQSPEDKLMKIHTEAHQNPEEFPLPKPPISNSIPPPLLDETTILSADQLPPVQTSKHHPQNIFTSQFLSSLLDKDPAHPGLPPDSKIQLYSYDSNPTDWSESSNVAERYSEQISLQIGGCKSLDERDGDLQGRVEYLFCRRDEE